MYQSLKINPYMTSQPIKNRNTPRSQPSSPRKFKIQKKVSNMTTLKQAKNIWKESSMSLTRQQSPIHKIPNSIRFKSIEEDSLKNTQFLTLELRKDIKTTEGKRFPKSHRPQHFVKGLGQHGPSPASYYCPRFLLQNNATVSLYNPESAQVTDSKMKWNMKGSSFATFTNYHKSYINHSKHKVYQPENIEGQPGPGKYQHSFVTKRKQSSYTMRSPLKRFNESLGLTPGPGAYGQVYGDRTTSPNHKGTFQQSKRTYLTKFQAFPSPQSYEVPRFLEKESKEV